MCHLKEDVKAHSSAAFASAPCKICFDSIDWKVTLRLHSPPPSQIGVAVTFNMFEINLPVLSLHFAFFFFSSPPISIRIVHVSPLSLLLLTEPPFGLWGWRYP